ncbi:Bifunctional inhibitor/lipid-transfer protein/seed storage 2S albumin superfamily protein [Perilla frutescens var. hirtella]|nr:Bifunctional inhibitor/lipid-transfer protein/seed storage 2S albumin superfamily protein [Perilla frutescens var. hirtella]
MMMKKSVAALWVVVMLVVMAAEVHEAADCNPTALMPCLGAISGGQEPSNNCCSKLKEQQPCFCQYIKNPAFKPYIDSPNARKVAAACNVTIPTC